MSPLPSSPLELALRATRPFHPQQRQQLLGFLDQNPLNDPASIVRESGIPSGEWESFKRESERERWQKLLENLQAGREHLLELTDPDYPPLLKELKKAPSPIFARGQVQLATREAVAIVGSRKADSQALRWTRELASSAVAGGLVVVSGAALGVDGAAHKGAGAGATIAVLGCGMDVGYPAAHQKLLREIGEQGLLISEWPPWVTADSFRFPRRNRLIAGLSRAVIVSMAARKSGALNTARHALDENRELLVCPGHPADPAYAGCLELLRQGARLLRHAGDLFEELQTLHFLELPAPQGSRSSYVLPPEPGSAQRRIWDCLDAPLNRESLRRALELTTGELSSLLIEMEFAGLLRALPGDRWEHV